MKNFRLLPFLAVFALIICSLSLKAQTGYEDVIYLKNGSIIHGIIIEQVPNVSVTIKTADNNTFVFKVEEIERIVKQPVTQTTGKKETIMMEDLRCYQGGVRLSKETVSRILQENNMTAYKQWKHGRHSLTASSVLMGIGIPITLLGAAAGIGFAISEDEVPFIIMLVSTPIGLGLVVGGTVSFFAGKRTVTRAIDTYNASLKISSAPKKIRFNIGLTQTQPGVGMTINF